jgi:hypothetical protein
MGKEIYFLLVVDGAEIRKPETPRETKRKEM